MKTTFQDLEYLHKEIKDKEAKKIIKELEENFHLLKSKSGLSQLMSKKKRVMIIFEGRDAVGKDDAKINLHHDPEIVECYHRRSHDEH